MIENLSQDGGQDGMDAILLCIENNSNSNKRTITYSAGNKTPILIRDNSIFELSKDKMPVGKGEKDNSFTLQTVNFKKGDTLYLYTDGFADQFGGPKGKKFMYKQLNELLLTVNSLPFDIQKENIESTFNSWKGDLEQVDEVCLIGIKF